MKPEVKTSPVQPLDYARAGMRPRRSHTRLIVVCGTALLILVWLLLSILPSGYHSPAKAYQVHCAMNLRQIGMAMQLYANDHGGQYPDKIQGLLEEDLTSAIFICPASNDVAASGATTQAVAANLTAGGHLSYVYLGKGFTYPSAPTLILAYEPPGHHRDGSNFLFGDGHVEFIAATKAAKIVAELKAGFNPPRAGKF